MFIDGNIRIWISYIATTVLIVYCFFFSQILKLEKNKRRYYWAVTISRVQKIIRLRIYFSVPSYAYYNNLLTRAHIWIINLGQYRIFFIFFFVFIVYVNFRRNTIFRDMEREKYGNFEIRTKYEIRIIFS